MVEIVYAVAAGADLYVFDDEGAAAGQAIALIGANFDVETFNVPAETWDMIREEMKTSIKGELVEVFRGEAEHPDATAMRKAAGRDI